MGLHHKTDYYAKSDLTDFCGAWCMVSMVCVWAPALLELLARVALAAGCSPSRRLRAALWPRFWPLAIVVVVMSTQAG